MRSDDGSSESDGSTPFKLAVVVRRDLGMTAGKLAAQAGHAVQDAIGKGDAALLRAWEADGSMIVVLQAQDELHIKRLHASAVGGRINANLVEDEGLTEVDHGACTALAVGPDEAAKVDAVTGQLGAYRSAVEEELEGLRQRLREAEKELVVWREGAGTPAGRSSINVTETGEVWLVLDVPSWAQALRRPVVPELFEQWCWEGDTTVLPSKWGQAVEECCGGDVSATVMRPWERPLFDPEGIFFLTQRSTTCGIAAALALDVPGGEGGSTGIIEGWGVQPAFRRKGLGRCLLRLCLQRHAELGRSRVFCTVDPQESLDGWRLLASEGFRPSS